MTLTVAALAAVLGIGIKARLSFDKSKPVRGYSLRTPKGREANLSIFLALAALSPDAFERVAGHTFTWLHCEHSNPAALSEATVVVSELPALPAAPVVPAPAFPKLPGTTGCTFDGSCTDCHAGGLETCKTSLDGSPSVEIVASVLGTPAEILGKNGD